MTIQTKKAKETLPVFVVNSQILQSFKKNIPRAIAG